MREYSNDCYGMIIGTFSLMNPGNSAPSQCGDAHAAGLTFSGAPKSVKSNSNRNVIFLKNYGSNLK